MGKHNILFRKPICYSFCLYFAGFVLPAIVFFEGLDYDTQHHFVVVVCSNVHSLCQ